jgi:hypothetical protein
MRGKSMNGLKIHPTMWSRIYTIPFSLLVLPMHIDTETVSLSGTAVVWTLPFALLHRDSERN